LEKASNESLDEVLDVRSGFVDSRHHTSDITQQLLLLSPLLSPALLLRNGRLEDP
jgi:hypothetical protein